MIIDNIANTTILKQTTVLESYVQYRHSDNIVAVGSCLFEIIYSKSE